MWGEEMCRSQLAVQGSWMRFKDLSPFIFHVLCVHQRREGIFYAANLGRKHQRSDTTFLRCLRTNQLNLKESKINKQTIRYDIHQKGVVGWDIY